MVAQTRSQTAGNQQTKTKEQKTKQRENNGIPKKGDSDKTSKTLSKSLNAAVDAYEKADDGKKAEIQNQLNVRQPMTKPEAMDEDDEEPAGEQKVKKESEEGNIFVSPINNDQDNSPEKGKGSPSDPKPSSDKEQDPTPSKAKIQNLLNVRQPMTKPEAMHEDDEKPAGEQKESEEGSMFVSSINNDQDSSPEKGKGSPSDPKPSSDKEQDPTPSSNNNHEKLPPPKVSFRNGLATPSTEAEDELDLVRANPVREIFHGGASENVGWSRLAFGRAFNIERQGPPNAARFRFKRHNDVIKTKSLDDLSYGNEKQLNGGKLYQCGDISSIQGVAWQPLKGIDHYSSLAPRNWKQGNRTVRPPMRIMVKWEGKAERGEEGQGVTRWEKRDAVWRCWEDERGHGGATVQCEEDLRLGEAVILEKGDAVSLCDFVIVTAAYRCEKRFQEWQLKQRPGRDRSPTPGLPLLSKENEKQPGSGESSDKAWPHTDKPEGAEAQADTTH